MESLNPSNSTSLLSLESFITAVRAFKMQNQREVSNVPKNLKNCFGFSVNEVNPLTWNDSSMLNDTSAPIEFRPDKPYRLALYVTPNDQRIIQRANATLIVKSIMEKQMKARKALNSTNRSIAKKTENGKVKKGGKKLQNVTLFNEKVKPETESKITKKTKEKPKTKKNVTLTEKSQPKKNILTESNIKSFPSLRQATIRRLYERKTKKNEAEILPDEPSSDEILKDLENKKLSSTKHKSCNKENEDFENWTSDVNSHFNDVDQFEMSVSYD